MLKLNRLSAKGFSLIEMAVVLLMISIAIAPIVKLSGGPTSDEGNSTQVGGIKSKELLTGNTILERAMSGDSTVLISGCRNNSNNCLASQVGINYNKDVRFNWKTTQMNDIN